MVTADSLLLALGQVVERRSGGFLSFFRSFFSFLYTLYGMGDGIMPSFASIFTVAPDADSES